ncbi:MAG: hypothetical protein K0Q57_541, partial [Gammaproteobacteria bacterium]|nr:hypothetical protein [Gammaproteobacteria bacterium]
MSNRNDGIELAIQSGSYPPVPELASQSVVLVENPVAVLTPQAFDHIALNQHALWNTTPNETNFAQRHKKLLNFYSGIIIMGVTGFSLWYRFINQHDTSPALSGLALDGFAKNGTMPEGIGYIASNATVSATALPTQYLNYQFSGLVPAAADCTFMAQNASWTLDGNPIAITQATSPETFALDAEETLQTAYVNCTGNTSSEIKVGVTVSALDSNNNTLANGFGIATLFYNASLTAIESASARLRGTAS